MRTTVIPAQITTIEDRIAGNLTLTQILLLITPVFITTVVYILVPTQMAFTLPKIVLTCILSLISITLSIRIKTRLILEWVMIISAYFLRPRIFVYNKNTSQNRYHYKYPLAKPSVQTVKNFKSKEHSRNNLTSTIDAVSILRGTHIAFRFTNKGIIATRSV